MRWNQLLKRKSIEVLIAEMAGENRLRRALGPLSLTAFQAMDAVTLVGAAASAMMSRKFLERRAGIVHRSALTELTVTATMPFPWQVDGDFIDISNELVLSYEPDVLELVVP